MNSMLSKVTKPGPLLFSLLVPNRLDANGFLKQKYNADGSFQRHKACLVAQGFTQIAGFDYNETYSPVVKPSTIRVVLSHAVTSAWLIRQIDVNNAFLNGDLQEDVYMKQPLGFEFASPNLVCKLHKALYGLKQAPRSWFQKLSSTLHTFGFHANKSDTSLFVKFMPSYTIYVLIYVDDIIITRSSKHEVTTLISNLSECFALKDLGPLHYFLGIEVTRLRNGDLLLSQSKYIIDLLRRISMLSANPLPTPMQSTLRLQQDASSAMTDPTL